MLVYAVNLPDEQWHLDGLANLRLELTLQQHDVVLEGQNCVSLVEALKKCKTRGKAIILSASVKLDQGKES